MQCSTLPLIPYGVNPLQTDWLDCLDWLKGIAVFTARRYDKARTMPISSTSMMPCAMQV